MNTTTPVDWVPAEQVPLRLWPGGSVRVGGTRVSLDTVIGEHHNGLSPEEIVRAYDCLELADVYAAIAFYLRNRVKVDEYLAEGHRKAEESRAYFRSAVSTHHTSRVDGSSEGEGEGACSGWRLTPM